MGNDLQNNMGATTGSPTRVALVVNSLGVGGVERQILTLGGSVDRGRLACMVVPVKAGGALGAGVSDGPVWSPQARRGFDPIAIWRFARELRRRRIEVILAANQYSTIFALLARSVSCMSIPIYSAFHSAPEHIGPGLRHRTLLRLYERALKQCAGLVYVSDLQREAWHRLSFARAVPSVVIKNGIDTDRFVRPENRTVRSDLGWGGEQFVVGLCATMRREKRIVDIVEAVSLLVAKGVPARLLIVGDGPERASIENACRQRLASDGYVLTGFQRDVCSYVHACDVMTLVSEAEAFSISVLEAMACGKPMVLTDVGGAREQIESGIHGYVVPVGAPQTVAERLESIWRTRSAANLGAAARLRVVEEFSIQRMVEAYTQLLQFSIPQNAVGTRKQSPGEQWNVAAGSGKV